MRKTNKRKLGVVLTNTFKFSSKKQFDLFAEFMRKYKMDLDDIYNIYTNPFFSDVEKDLNKIDILWICNSQILPKNDKWNVFFGLSEMYKKHNFQIYDYSIDNLIQPNNE